MEAMAEDELLTDATNLVRKPYDRTSFLAKLISDFKNGIDADISLKTEDGRSAIPVHRILLKSRSEVFKDMIECAEGLEVKTSDSITITDLQPDELESLVEFLYYGTLSNEKLQKHVYSLFITAHKFDIPFLYGFCEAHMRSNLSTSTALDVVTLADMCSNMTLKDTTINFVVANMEDIVSSDKFEAFSIKNNCLCLEITRAYVANTNRRLQEMEIRARTAEKKLEVNDCCCI